MNWLILCDSFKEYLLDNLDDHVEFYGAEDWDDYQDTIADGWYNR